MAIKSALWSVGGSAAVLGLFSGPVLAGAPCGPAGGLGCDTDVSILTTPIGHPDVTTIENRTPYDYFDSVHFQRSPHVSITRIHGLDPKIGLSDSPVGFTDSCHPESTTYCRSGHAATKTLAPHVQAPVASQPPVVSRPYRPVVSAPIVSAPVPPRIVAVGRGYDASKFTPRIYGDPYTITPGIAHVPTSYVDRDPYRAQAVLDSGRARPNPVSVPGGITPALVGVPVRPPVHNPYATGHYAGQAYSGGAAFAQSSARANMRSSAGTGRYHSQSWGQAVRHPARPAVCRSNPTYPAHPPHAGPCRSHGISKSRY